MPVRLRPITAEGGDGTGQQAAKTRRLALHDHSGGGSPSDGIQLADNPRVIPNSLLTSEREIPRPHRAELLRRREHFRALGDLLVNTLPDGVVFIEHEGAPAWQGTGADGADFVPDWIGMTVVRHDHIDV